MLLSELPSDTATVLIQDHLRFRGSGGNGFPFVAELRNGHALHLFTERRVLKLSGVNLLAVFFTGYLPGFRYGCLNRFGFHDGRVGTSCALRGNGAVIACPGVGSLTPALVNLVDIRKRSGLRRECVALKRCRIGCLTHRLSGRFLCDFGRSLNGFLYVMVVVSVTLAGCRYGAAVCRPFIGRFAPVMSERRSLLGNRLSAIGADATLHAVGYTGCFLYGFFVLEMHMIVRIYLKRDLSGLVAVDTLLKTDSRLFAGRFLRDTDNIPYVVKLLNFRCKLFAANLTGICLYTRLLAGGFLRYNAGVILVIIRLRNRFFLRLITVFTDVTHYTFFFTARFLDNDAVDEMMIGLTGNLNIITFIASDAFEPHDNAVLTGCLRNDFAFLEDMSEGRAFFVPFFSASCTLHMTDTGLVIGCILALFGNDNPVMSFRRDFIGIRFHQSAAIYADNLSGISPFGTGRLNSVNRGTVYAYAGNIGLIAFFQKFSAIRAVYVSGITDLTARLSLVSEFRILMIERIDFNRCRVSFLNGVTVIALMSLYTLLCTCRSGNDIVTPYMPVRVNGNRRAVCHESAFLTYDTFVSGRLTGRIHLRGFL